MTNYLVVGAGLFGAVFAHEAAQRGHKVKVIEKRDHVAGNIYTKEVHGIQVHQFGAHIFHTSKKEIWEYVNQFAEFNRYTNSPVANYNGEIYNLPFNMNTVYLFCINISGNMISFFNNLYFVSSLGSFMCKYCTKKTCTYY